MQFRETASLFSSKKTSFFEIFSNEAAPKRPVELEKPFQKTLILAFVIGYCTIYFLFLEHCAGRMREVIEPEEK